MKKKKSGKLCVNFHSAKFERPTQTTIKTCLNSSGNKNSTVIFSLLDRKTRNDET